MTKTKKKGRKVNKTDASYWKFLVALIILTSIVYSFSIGNGWVNWDDPDYVLKNIAVQNFDLSSIWTEAQAYNYHPLTMMSLAFDWLISGDSPWFFHLHNVVLHILNVVLVFYLVFSMTKGKTYWSLLVAAGFALHPMHVESVAWISERKDVLYSAYFLASLILYWRYLLGHKWRDYGLSLLLFSLAILSKPSAMMLPFLLILMDYWGQKNWKKYIFHKIPFLILAVAIAFITFSVQSDEAVNSMQNDGILNRLCYASYGYIMYLVKFAIPTCLCAFYSYPLTSELPTWFYGMLGVSILSIIPLWFYGIRQNRKYLVWAWLFFVINLLPVLQFVSVGAAIMADRYTYIAYIGLLFGLGGLINSLKPKTQKVIVLALVIVWSSMSIRQISHWKDGGTLWAQVEKCSPFNNPMIGQNRASFFREQGNSSEALKGIQSAMKLNPNDPENYINRGNIYFDDGKYKLALQDYNQALEINPKHILALQNRGSMYASQQKYDAAIADLSIVLQESPKNLKSLSFRALAYYYKGDLQSASVDYRAYLDIDKKNDEMWSEYALVLRAKGASNLALQSIDQALILKPEKPDYLVNAAIIYADLDKLKQARAFAFKAQQLGAQLPRGLVEKLQIK